eukprot:gnl/TRDRNA2_/TRDRNA2_163341_c0_seq1.p1 gnl/TRDRNA2_/TRDRNA2_163341_c0~~gnl/TRDRNA2_/TRDRNA2_163341_c0_seq1.p1  ORF type:complete len:355 (-),score=65.82 gnl/TRDRNA2_/TRDRNA2_163341_c0_seq1:11-922(-)
MGAMAGMGALGGGMGGMAGMCGMGSMGSIPGMGGGKGMGKGLYSTKSFIQVLNCSGDLPGGASWKPCESELYIRGLAQDCKNEDVYSMFARFGAIATNGAWVQTDHGSTVCRGIGFVNYIHKESAQAAIERMNGWPLPDGQKLLVKLKTKHSEESKEGSWTCSQCNNVNFASRLTCNRCQSDRNSMPANTQAPGPSEPTAQPQRQKHQDPLAEEFRRGAAAARSNSSTAAKEAPKRPAEPSGSFFKIGMKVQLRGLKAKPELNGKEGTIQEYKADAERWSVKLDGVDGTSIAVKEVNMIELSD